MDGTGRNVRQLTVNNGRDGGPAWSPDGKRIAYASAPTFEEQSKDWVMDADGGDPVQLTFTEIRPPATEY